MQNVTLIAIDLGKRSFHVHAQDKNGNALLRKKFSRTQLTAFLSACTASTVVMEACADAHFMTRHICQRGQRVAATVTRQRRVMGEDDSANHPSDRGLFGAQ
ncbi:hypothetical protein PEC301645_21150 [Pectobacterium carotovorum subsp. carotovorum]|nr:hypothetical protein PEC301645_21150 [Pectobacterium carotovorum subsp. carotovorum]